MLAKILTSYFLVWALAQNSLAASVIKDSHSLLITDLSVVNSSYAQRDWSFTSTSKRLKSQGSISGFLTDWLGQWSTVSQINAWPVRTLDHRNLLRFWPLDRGTTDFESSPFILSAIVYRPDLAAGGEFRLVYTGHDSISLQALPITIIFEFKIPHLDALRIRQSFIELSDLDFGDEFNARVSGLYQELTDLSHLSQVRVNDFLLNEVWDLREFHVVNGHLVMATTAATPSSALSPEAFQELVQSVEASRTQVMNGSYQLPQKLLGGMALTPHEDFMWFDDVAMDEDLKKAFSLMTCNGCHAGATNTRFTHISPREMYRESELSPFLVQELKARRRYLETFKAQSYRLTH